VPKKKVVDPTYAKRPADMSRPVLYEYKYTNPAVENEIRMHVRIDEFIDVRTSKTVATYKSFTYSKFNPDNTLLGAPSGEQCPEDFPLDDPNTGKRIPMKREIAISSIFIK
jgi:hypothetical protein